jgi:hypothetical protein
VHVVGGGMKAAPKAAGGDDGDKAQPQPRGGLSSAVVKDLARRLPGLCGGGRGGEVEALKLIAAVVAARKTT